MLCALEILLGDAEPLLFNGGTQLPPCGRCVVLIKTGQCGQAAQDLWGLCAHLQGLHAAAGGLISLLG